MLDSDVLKNEKMTLGASEASFLVMLNSGVAWVANGKANTATCSSSSDDLELLGLIIDSMVCDSSRMLWRCCFL